MIPPEIQNFETYIVAYSGGKDSTATLLWALDNLPRERIRAVFCDTGAEWPETYSYLGYIERELEIEIERVRAGDRPLPPKRDGTPRECMADEGTTLLDKIRLRGKWPAPRYRFCTTYLKHWPLRLYARQFASAVQIEGSRAQESPARAKKPQFDPSGNKTGDPMYRPVLYWPERQIWDYLRAYGILPNPVYNYTTRCGCWCCIMGKPREVLNFCRLHPDIAQVAADLEQEIDHTWRARHSITNLLRQAQAQAELFTPQPRFAEVGKC